MSAHRTLIIADAHVSEANGNVESFFKLLEKLESIPGDIVFLGDVFDLWVGFRRYQAWFHRKFITWCKEQKAKRAIGLIEGNHEFFVEKNFGDAFSWCHPEGCVFKNLLLVHGDMINSRDHKYLRFRRFTKNALAAVVVRILPWGVRITDGLKQKLKTTNMAYKTYLPEQEILLFARQQRALNSGSSESKTSLSLVFGHFHIQKEWELGDGARVFSMPAWVDTGLVAAFDDSENSRPIYMNVKDLH